MLARVRTFVAVTLIALLVWIVAEGQTLRSQSATLEIEFETGSNTRVVRVDPAEDFKGFVELRLSGSAGRLDDIGDALRESLSINVDAETVTGTGLRVVDLRDALRSTPLFGRSGVTLAEVTPRFVQIEVDELVQRDVPVRVELPADVQIDGEARAQPEVVGFSLPRQASEALAPDEVYAKAIVGPELLASLPTGRAQRINAVRIAPSQALEDVWYKRANRTQVAVSLTLRSRTATEMLPTVPVQLRVAPTELSRFDITIPESDLFIHDVTIRGPSTLVERMRSDPSLRPVAVVALSFEELERGIGAKDAQFIFPVGLESLEATADDVNVTLKIQRRPELPTEERDAG